jgi:copper chaperone
MKAKTLLINGMSCHHCIMAVKKELSKLNLIVKDVKIGSAEIEYDEEKISHEQLEEAIKESGYSLKN